MQQLPIFATWRVEIESELEAAKTALADANAALRAATESAREAKLEKLAMADAFARLGQRTAVASALAFRRRHREDAMREPEGALISARQRVQSAHLSIEDLQAALDQLNAIAPLPQPVEDLEEAA